MRRSALTAITLTAALALAGCQTAADDAAIDTEDSGTLGSTAADDDREAAFATASLADPEGQSRGTVEFREAEGGVEVHVTAEGLEPGFRGFHLHGIGECETDSANPDDPADTGDFLSAGPHLGDGEHPEHAGDMPPLLVLEDGTATATFVTDRVEQDTLLDDDGSVVIVHGDPDNFANIPERYAAEGPDDDTTGTGDAGSRVACGVVEGS